tara:strand:- start:151 stop:525 length:375 start_codon:yes stop_codon:yes gene_type:complete
MTEKKDKKLTYALTESSAIKQITEANQLHQRAKSLLKSYLCSDYPLKYADNAIDTLTEYMSNVKFYASILERQLFAGERVESKKGDEENIIVPYEEFALISSYLVVTAACENELETLGISMRLH